MASTRAAVLALVLASWSGVAQAATYTNYRNFTGSSFFSGFSFVTGYDNVRHSRAATPAHF